MSQQKQIPDNPSIPVVPAGSADIADVLPVLGRRQDEDIFSVVVTVDAPSEVDWPSTEHDGRVGQRKVQPAGGSSTKARQDA